MTRYSLARWSWGLSPYLNNPPPINAHRVWRDELVIVTHPEHPLQKKRRTVQLSELSAYPSILPNRNTFTRRIIEQAFLERSAQLSVTIETNYLETNRMLISIGLGWGVIPRSMCDESVTILSIPTLSLERGTGVYLPYKEPKQCRHSHHSAT